MSHFLRAVTSALKATTGFSCCLCHSKNTVILASAILLLSFTADWMVVKGNFKPIVPRVLSSASFVIKFERTTRCSSFKGFAQYGISFLWLCSEVSVTKRWAVSVRRCSWGDVCGSEWTTAGTWSMSSRLSLPSLSAMSHAVSFLPALFNRARRICSKTNQLKSQTRNIIKQLKYLSPQTLTKWLGHGPLDPPGSTTVIHLLTKHL